MKKSEIRFTVELDPSNVPDKIFWDATDNPNEGLSDTKAIAVALWDHYHRSTMKIDLWTKDMEVLDMKRFIIEIMSGLADTAMTATGDQLMADDIENLCRTISKRVEEEFKAQNQPTGGK
ncbi:gliding motility protein GldC [Nibrella viscosa]|uniref:Gliding motility protein GldC n=1 Tax=Nibrella viscosa TaxID=1084524 RepID=A0ABP8KMM0_9BACT